MKRIESLLHTARMKFKFENLEISFHKGLISFLVVKTVKCKRSISLGNIWSRSLLERSCIPSNRC